MRTPDKTAYWLWHGLQFGAVGLVVWIGWAMWAALLDQEGPNQLKVPVRIDQDVEAHLYYDVGQGLWAGHVVIQQLPGDSEWRVLSFALPRKPIRALRFDPMLTPGRFAIKAPWLESRTGRVIAKFPQTAVTPRHQIVGWREVGDRYEAITWADADDAQVQFELGWPLRVGEPRWPWTEGGILTGVIVAILLLGRHPGVKNRVRWRTQLRHRATVGGTELKRWGRLAVASYFDDSRRMIGIGALVLLLGQGWVLRGLSETLDLPMWDESNYAARGVAWAKDGGPLGDLHTGPALVVTYAGLSWGGSADEIVFWQHYLVKMGGTLALYFLLVKWWRRWPAALAVSLAWACTWFQTEYPLLVYQAAWMWFLVAMLVIDRWVVLGILLLGWTIGFRQDYQFALPIVFLAVGWRWWRGRKNGNGFGAGWGRRQRWAVGVVSLVGVLALAWGAQQVGFRGVGQRGWFAFQQHYALRAVKTGEVVGINPLADYPRVMAQDFPGATSLASAWQTNPAAMMRHVRWNLQQAAVELVKLWQPQGTLLMAFMILVAAAVVALMIDAQIRPWSWRGEGETMMSLALAAGALFVVGPGIVVLAKGPYLLPLVPLALWLVATGVKAMGARLPKLDRANAAMVGLGAVGLGLGLVGGARSGFDPSVGPRPVKDTLAVLREIWPETGKYPLIAYGASSWSNYLGHDRSVGIEPLNAVTGSDVPDRSLAELLVQEQPFAVIVGADWRNSADVDEALLADWSQREVAVGKLYWKKP